MTNAQAYKKREQENREAVKRWLKLTENEANDMFIDSAYDYLKNILGTDAYGLEHLPKTSEFWFWWRLEFNRIDAIFLEALRHPHPECDWYANIMDRDSDTLYKVQDVHDLRKWYEIYHENSMQNRYVNSSVVRAGAHSVIKSIVANARAKEVSHG